MRPDLRDIKHRTSILLSLLWLHDLDRKTPDRILAPRNCIEKFLVMVVRVDASKTAGFSRRHVGNALDRAKVELAVLERTLRGNKLECVHTEPSDSADRSWNASRAEEVEEGMCALRVVNMKIPELER